MDVGGEHEVGGAGGLQPLPQPHARCKARQRHTSVLFRTRRWPEAEFLR
jgi:hypothetical protein